MRSRSCDLLRRVVGGGDVDAIDILRELSLSPTDLAGLLAGTRAMSLPCQLRFAELLIERVPGLAARGRTLRDQAMAATAYGSGATTIHASRPLKWSDMKARRA